MRTRREEDANYSSIFFDGKTLRMPINSDKEVTELRYPEFWDISLGNKCVTGKCNYCYASGNPHGVRYSNIVDKVNDFFGSMTQNQRPYQIATGGESESLEHPEFWQYCEALCNLGIVPNFTTNGVLVNERIIDRIKKYVGGVAVTYHPHLEKFFHRALRVLVESNIKTNIHFIVSDTESVELLKKIYSKYNQYAEYFVLLKYINVGFAANHPKEVDYDSLESFCDEVHSNGNLAFGARFHDWLCKNKKYDVSLYPPEILSKYLIMDDEMKVCNNSFECKRVEWSNNGCVV